MPMYPDPNNSNDPVPRWQQEVTEGPGSYFDIGAMDVPEDFVGSFTFEITAMATHSGTAQAINKKLRLHVARFSNTTTQANGAVGTIFDRTPEGIDSEITATPMIDEANNRVYLHVTGAEDWSVVWATKVTPEGTIFAT